MLTRAIKLAQEVSLPLTFLYVVNRELVSNMSVSSAHTVVKQMRQVGSSMMLLAQAIANSHGVPSDSAVCYGCVEDEITGLCQELDADYLVLSHTDRHRETSVSTPERLARFRARIEKEAGAKVILAEGEGP
jgi:hypothetical protein